MKHKSKNISSDKYRVDLFIQLKDILVGHNIRSVANVSGISYHGFCFWLTGKTEEPRLDTICKVTFALGYKIKIVHDRRKFKMRIIK